MMTIVLYSRARGVRWREGCALGFGKKKQRRKQRFDVSQNLIEISLAKDPTICSCEYRLCEQRIRWGSLWGHETLSWVGETHVSAATGGLRWSSLWGYETCERCAESRGKEGEEKGAGGGGGGAGTRGTVSSKRGPNTTGWLGKRFARSSLEETLAFIPRARARTCTHANIINPSVRTI